MALDALLVRGWIEFLKNTDTCEELKYVSCKKLSKVKE